MTKDGAEPHRRPFALAWSPWWTRRNSCSRVSALNHHSDLGCGSRTSGPMVATWRPSGPLAHRSDVGPARFRLLVNRAMSWPPVANVFDLCADRLPFCDGEPDDRLSSQRIHDVPLPDRIRDRYAAGIGAFASPGMSGASMRSPAIIVLVAILLAACATMQRLTRRIPRRCSGRFSTRAQAPGIAAAAVPAWMVGSWR